MLIDHEGHLVLCDFGLARDFHGMPTVAERAFQPFWPYARKDMLTPTTRRRDGSDPALQFTLKAMCGTGLHMSPELVRGEWYSFGVDIWALGVCLYMMLTGRPPFDTESPEFEELKKEICIRIYCFCQRTTSMMSLRISCLRSWRKIPRTDYALRRSRRSLSSKACTCHPLQLLLLSLTGSLFTEIWVLMEQRAVLAPWIPPFERGHVMYEKPGPFVPGVPFDGDGDGAGPYPEFEYISEDVKQGIIREEDIMEQDPEVEGEVDLFVGQDAPPCSVKDFFRRVFGPKSRGRTCSQSTSMSMTSSAADVANAYLPPSPFFLPRTPSIPSISSSPWLAFDTSVGNDEPDGPFDDIVLEDIEAGIAKLEGMIEGKYDELEACVEIEGGEEPTAAAVEEPSAVVPIKEEPRGEEKEEKEGEGEGEEEERPSPSLIKAFAAFLVLVSASLVICICIEYGYGYGEAPATCRL
ncbi:hypothetical protein D9615_010205 [Tricholomella constricta]|uniref:non-specific serine/threonine protein kinase n=1 Tax=Tricholomella constricta TaxID=117010 RepID=A0A8H5GNG2_9AGAR|nr:hypothetical protein D9615_010205 [Tricholomella constricta]